MRDEAGQVGGVEAVVFGTLILVIGTLVVANLWAVIDTKFATSAAAQEATRTFVEATDETEAFRRADVAARRALAGYGRDAARAEVTVQSGGLERCVPVTIRVAYRVALGAVPVLGRGGRTVKVSSEHTEVVDPYRSGLAGRCP